METKVCSKCNIEKKPYDFGKYKNAKDGLKKVCKDCRKIESKNRYKNNKDYFLKYRADNKKNILLKNKEYRENNPELRKQHYQKNKEKEKKYAIEYRKNNEFFYRNYYNNRYKTDVIFRLNKIIRSRLNKKLRKYDSNNSKKTIEVLGCTIQELRDYIEKQFKEGMTWNNRGLKGWHIDHIIPLSSAKTEEELYKLCHYSNLQPLWAEENMKKSDKIINH